MRAEERDGLERTPRADVPAPRVAGRRELSATRRAEKPVPGFRDRSYPPGLPTASSAASAPASDGMAPSAGLFVLGGSALLVLLATLLLLPSMGSADRRERAAASAALLLLALFGVGRVMRRYAVREAAARIRATHDELTGLPNRALLTDRLDALLARPRDERTVSLLFLDLDGFKLINDSYGHRAGDELLVAAAQLLRGAVRAEDFVARLGGDEFVVLGRHTDPTGAEILAGRIVAAFTAPFQLSVGSVFVSTSIGIGHGSSPHASSSAEGMLSDADTAMYSAKASGRNRWAVFDAPLRAAVRARLETGTELRFALERRQLDVHYQPIVALSDGMIVGVEALLRWRHPSRGLLGPDQFLSVAEETGLILPIGDWVLRTALRELAIRRQGSASLTVSVNVSGRQLRDGALVDSVRAALDESGLPGAALCLDLTETALAEDPDLTAAALAALRDLGVVICIEDFGTGHSGLGYLKRFPISMVKIHRDLVAGLGHNRDDATIVSAVAAMAHALGLSVVGEGVESEMQESELRRLGCDLGQGLRYAAPGPAARVGRRLRSDLGSDPGIRPPYLAAAMPSPTRGLGTSAAASWTTQ